MSRRIHITVYADPCRVSCCNIDKRLNGLFRRTIFLVVHILVRIGAPHALCVWRELHMVIAAARLLIWVGG
jgi:hypothetical protein